MSTNILQNDFLQLEYAADALRIIGLTPAGKSNLLADLRHQPPIATPYGDFHFRGGHRLWHAPEAMPRTYIPDSTVMVTKAPNSIALESQTEPGTGIRKRIEIHLAPNRPSVTLTHTLINDGLWAIELAPWTITQFRFGRHSDFAPASGFSGCGWTSPQPATFTFDLHPPHRPTPEPAR